MKESALGRIRIVSIFECVWALAYGVATTAASHFYVLPSMGLGVFGRRSPEGIKGPLSPLANHLFYGVGIAVAVTLA